MGSVWRFHGHGSGCRAQWSCRLSEGMTQTLWVVLFVADTGHPPSLGRRIRFPFVCDGGEAWTGICRALIAGTYRSRVVRGSVSRGSGGQQAGSAARGFAQTWSYSETGRKEQVFMVRVGDPRRGGGAKGGEAVVVSHRLF